MTVVDTQAAILAAGISRRTLQRRVAAGLLNPIGQDHRGRTLYRLDDVLSATSPAPRKPCDTTENPVS